MLLPCPVKTPPSVTASPAGSSGGKGSAQFRSGSELVESLTANGVTVQVSLQDTGWKMRANVAVVNSSKQAIFVLPKLVSLDELAR